MLYRLSVVATTWLVIASLLCACAQQIRKDRPRMCPINPEPGPPRGRQGGHISDEFLGPAFNIWKSQLDAQQQEWLPKTIQPEPSELSVTVLLLVDVQQPLSYVAETIASVCEHTGANRIHVVNCVLLPAPVRTESLHSRPALARIVERAKQQCGPRNIRIELLVPPPLDVDALPRSLVAPVASLRTVVSNEPEPLKEAEAPSVAYLEIDTDWEADWHAKWMADIEQYDDDWLLFDDDDDDESSDRATDDDIHSWEADELRLLVDGRRRKPLSTRAQREMQAINEWEARWEQAFSQAAKRAREQWRAGRYVDQQVSSAAELAAAYVDQLRAALVGNYLVVVEHGVALSSAVSIDHLVFRLLPSYATAVRVAGGQITDYGQLVCLSAGLELAVEGYVPVHQRDWAYAKASRNVVRLHHRYADALADSARLAKPSYVDSVSGLFAVTAAHFVAALSDGDGQLSAALLFDWLRLSETYRAVPFSFGSDEAPPTVMYEPAGAGHYLGEPDRYASATSNNEFDEACVERHTAAWEQRVRSRMAVNSSVVSAVVWVMECSAGQAQGFTREAVDFVVALERLLPLSVYVHDWNTCREQVIGAFPRHQRQAIVRLAQKRVDDSVGVVMVVHRDPGVYEDVHRQTQAQLFDAAKLRYTVGRAMYETDRIPADWLAKCNNYDLVQEIWVPSSFGVAAFTAAGVKAERLHVVPEPLDVHHFDPALRPAFERAPLPALDHSPRRAFAFLSVFKWEERKNWRALLSAYFDEFTSHDSVCLYIRSSLDVASWQQFDAFLNSPPSSSFSSSSSLLSTYAQRTDLPAVVFLHQPIEAARLPQLYAAANAFVLPTRGEGWGLPVVEAMAMGLPVIATNWSGITQYLNDGNGYPLPIAGLQQHDSSDHLWAQPSHDHLRRLMRQLFSRAAPPPFNPRDTIVSQFAPHVVAAQVVARLQRITDIIVARQEMAAKLAQRRQTVSGFGREYHPINIINEQ